MTTKDLTCKKCHGQMELSDDKQYLVCPLCGSREIIDESDAVKIEKIRSQVERVKLKEKSKKFLWGIRIGAVLAVALLLAYGIYALCHRNHVRTQMEPKDYIGQKFQVVVAELEDVGFTDIETMEIADLDMSEKSRIEKVSQVSINGSTVFTKRTWFEKDAPIKVTYHTLDPKRKNDIQVPDEFDSYKGQDYNIVVAKLKSAGFKNIETIEIQDLDMSQENLFNLVSLVAIGGKTEFGGYSWVENSALVEVTYHSLDPSRKNDVQIPEDNTSYEGQDYSIVVAKLKSIGFTNIELQAVYDIKMFSKNKVGEVEKIFINGDREFPARKWYANNALIQIYYHEKESSKDSTDQVKPISENDIVLPYSYKALKGKNFEEVADDLAKEGFNNIKKDALGDLKKGWLHKEGEVESVSIDGDVDFSKGSMYAKDVEIIITYHSFADQ